MSLRKRLRVVFVCAFLQFGTLVGVPMRPEEIEALMRQMSAPKLAHTLPDEEEGGKPPPPDPLPGGTAGDDAGERSSAAHVLVSQTRWGARYMVRMLYALRHLLSVLILPATAVVVIPVWLARVTGTGWAAPATAGDRALVAAGALAFAVGFVLFAGSLRRFFVEGRGTLAPWDPPRRLVVRGLYRHVRNPMISGVIFMLCGMALGLRSMPHGQWAAVFVAANLFYIPLFEEPQLEARFGDAYRRYRAAVPRFVPRVRPWTDGS